MSSKAWNSLMLGVLAVTCSMTRHLFHNNTHFLSFLLIFFLFSHNVVHWWSRLWNVILVGVSSLSLLSCLPCFLGAHFALPLACLCLLGNSQRQMSPTRSWNLRMSTLLPKWRHWKLVVEQPRPRRLPRLQRGACRIPVTLHSTQKILCTLTLTLSKVALTQ